MANVFFTDAAWDWLVGYPHRAWFLSLAGLPESMRGKPLLAYQPTVYRAVIPDPDGRLLTVTFAIFGEGTRYQRTKILAITWT